MSPHGHTDIKSEPVVDAVTNGSRDKELSADVSLINGGTASVKQPSPRRLHNSTTTIITTAITTTAIPPLKRVSSSTVKSHSQSRSPAEQESNGDGGEQISIKREPSQPPKLARSASQKVVPRPPCLFGDLPDSTADAQATFQTLEFCTYMNKHMGYTEHAMECDCAEEWGKLISSLYQYKDTSELMYPVS
jgi:histone-lysine N-methyltransferase SETD2